MLLKSSISNQATFRGISRWILQRLSLRAVAVIPPIALRFSRAHRMMKRVSTKRASAVIRQLPVEGWCTRPVKAAPPTVDAVPPTRAALAEQAALRVLGILDTADAKEPPVSKEKHMNASSGPSLDKLRTVDEKKSAGPTLPAGDEGDRTCCAGCKLNRRPSNSPADAQSALADVLSRPYVGAMLCTGTVVAFVVLCLALFALVPGRSQFGEREMQALFLAGTIQSGGETHRPHTRRSAPASRDARVWAGRVAQGFCVTSSKRTTPSTAARGCSAPCS